jgi:drug/metabolite transporter (DMT)-like permease
LGALALALAVGSSIVWGAADFAGGSLTKRLPTLAVTVLSQTAGFVALLAIVAVRGEVGGRPFVLGLLGGIGGGVGLAAFYRALSLGTMSVVSPVVACGAVLPFAISIATGERPSGLALAGAGAALGGAVLASVEERRSDSPDRIRAITLAVVAAGSLGLFVYFLGLGSRHGDALSTLLGARVGSLTVLVALATARRAPLRIPKRWLFSVSALGLADVTANVLFAYAAGHGLLALVSVLGSLYPVVTVLLAHTLLGERLTRTQRAGVLVALAGVAVIAGG